MIAKFVHSKKVVLLVIFACVFACLTVINLTTANPVSEIEKLGGTIGRYRNHAAAVWLNDQGWFRASQWMYKAFPRVGRDRVFSVDLRGDRFTDKHLACLTNLNHLSELHLNGTQVSDTGLAYLGGLTNLKELSLSNTQITDAGLIHLEGLPKLGTLLLDSTQITAASFPYLISMNTLQMVNLSNTQVTKEELEDLLRAMPDLNIY